MDDVPSPVLDAVVRLGRVGLMLAVVVTAMGSLVAPMVTGHLSEDGDPVALGLVQCSTLEFEPRPGGLAVPVGMVGARPRRCHQWSGHLVR